MSLLLSGRILRRVVLCVVVAAIIVALATTVLLRDAISAGHEVEAAQIDLRGVLHGGELLHVTRSQIAEARRKLDDASRRLHRDRHLLSPLFPLMRGASWLPLIGEPASEAPDLLALAQEVASGGADLARGVDPLLAETESAGSGPRATASATAAVTAVPSGDTAAGGTAVEPSPGARLVNALDAGSTSLTRGDRSLHRAVSLRTRVHAEIYRGPLRPLRHQIALLDSDLSAIVRQADALALLPVAARTLFGFVGPRTYVILGQDSAELRPTGGFIGSAGLITFDRGKLTFQEYRSSYDLDALTAPPLPPPAPLVQYLGSGAWYVRDANWSPDFPTTSHQVLDFIARATGVQADGVLGFDNFAVTDLLSAVGPVQVEGFPELVTAENWFDLSTQTILTGQGSLENQLQDRERAKGVGLGAVLRTVLSRTESIHGRDLLAVVDGLRKATLGNHLQLGLNDQQPATWARLVSADGALNPIPDGDVIAPVEANLSYSKIGPYIERSLQYDVWLDGGGRPERSQLALTFRNTVTDDALADPNKRIGGLLWHPETGKFEESLGMYGDYLRLYLPGGSAIDVATGIAGLLFPTFDGGYGVFGGFVTLGPRAERTVTYIYRNSSWQLPAGAYQLTLFKQAGIDEFPATIVIHLAAGSVVESLPVGAQRDGDLVSMDLNVGSTTRIELKLAQRRAP